MAKTTLQVRIPRAELEAINSLVEESQLALANCVQFDRAFTMAAAVRQIGQMITSEMMEDIMQLQGLPLGFRTDRDDKGGYKEEEVKNCLIEATLFGARPVGNEFNIISARAYFTKEYFVRKVRDDERITDFHCTPGAVENKGGNAYVDYVAVWALDGYPMRIEKVRRKLASGQPFDDRIVVRVNEKMGYDAVIGKATRKMYREILQKITTASTVPMDGEAGDVIDATSTPAKPVKSTLFDDDPVDPEGAPEDQAPLLQAYRRRLDDCKSKAHVGTVAKQAGGDGSLSDASRKTVMGWCTERQKTV